MEVYLDNAATSHPKPESVLEAMRTALTEGNGNPGRSGHRRALSGARLLYQARERIAELIGAEDPSEIIHCFNCTDALNTAIKGCVPRGAHVVSTLLEHNSVLRVLDALRRTSDVEITLLAPNSEGFVDPADIERALGRNTALCVVTQASNVTGALQPVAAIGRMLARHGVPYLVDGAQALGVQPTDVRAIGCQMYAFPGHKGLLGPQGTGGLYIENGFELTPLREGGTGSSSESMTQPAERPERYESGTLNLPGVAGLSAGVAYVAPRRARIQALERELTARLCEALRAIEGVAVYGPGRAEDRAGVVSFNIGDLPSGAVADALDARGIAVRGGLHCAPGAHRTLDTLQRGAVRASVGHESTHEEIDALLRAVYEIAKRGTGGVPEPNET